MSIDETLINKNETTMKEKLVSILHNKILILCVNFVICSNTIIFFRPDIHNPLENFLHIKDFFDIAPFNLSSRPLLNLLYRLFALFLFRTADMYYITTLLFSPFLIYIFYEYLGLYEFKNSIRNMLLLIFSTLVSFQNYTISFNYDFLFLIFFLTALYYLKLENTKIFILFSTLAILSKEVAILLPILYFFIHLNTRNYLFNKKNLVNILIVVPFFLFLFITRFILNPSYFTFYSKFFSFMAPELSFMSAFFFLGMMWLIPIFEWTKISKIDKIYIGILFGIYLPLVLLLGNIWELKLIIPFSFVFIPSLGYWLENTENSFFKS